MLIVSFFPALLLLIVVSAHAATSPSFDSAVTAIRPGLRHLEEQQQEAEEQQNDDWENDMNNNNGDGYYDTIELEPFTGPQLTYQGCHDGDKSARFVVCPASDTAVATCSAWCRGGEEYTTGLLYFTRLYGAAMQREQYVRCNTAMLYCGAGGYNENDCYAAYGCWKDDQQYNQNQQQNQEEDQENEDNQDNNNNNYNNYQVQGGQNRKYYSCTASGQYFIGPYCSHNKIYQGLFDDSSCSVLTNEGTYESLYNGNRLVASKETGTPLMQRSQCAACSVTFTANNNDDGNNNNQEDEKEENENDDAAYQNYNFEDQAQSGLPSGCAALAYSGDYIQAVTGFSLDAFFGSPEGWIVMSVMAAVTFVVIVGWALAFVNGGGAILRRNNNKKMAPPLIETSSSEE